MSALFWLAGWMFCVGFCFIDEKKMPWDEQLGLAFITFVAWPIFVGAELRDILKKRDH